MTGSRIRALVDGKALRVSANGRVRLNELLANERKHIDSAALAAAYADFRAVNAEFKALVTDWQVKDDQPNTHEDPDYDAAVLARLDDVHHRVTPIVAAAAAQVPRLSRYSAKLQAALDNVHAGDTIWLSRPLIDSYHTVWFELHEEFIVAAGLTREIGSEIWLCAIDFVRAQRRVWQDIRRCHRPRIRPRAR